MRAASISVAAPVARPLASKRLLALAGDERLVEQIRKGNDAAFEVAFERHGPAILAFCRHMLGSHEEAEDAVQQTFASAFHDLQRDGRAIALKPWLFTIARNRCLSMLRTRRELPVEEPVVPTVGLGEQVEQRGELRQLLADVRELPDEQRAALLLAELGDLSHADIAGVLGCEVRRVKALVFRARSALISRRAARETPCAVIREQLANLRGGSLRRTELRLHLRECPGCSAYRKEVKLQRELLAAALPVAPALGLKSSVLAAVGIGAGSAGGGVWVAKVAVVGVLAGAGIAGGQAVVSHHDRPAAGDAAAGHARDALGARNATEPSARGVGRVNPSYERTKRPTPVGERVHGEAQERTPARGADPKRSGIEGPAAEPPAAETPAAEAPAVDAPGGDQRGGHAPGRHRSDRGRSKSAKPTPPGQVKPRGRGNGEAKGTPPGQVKPRGLGNGEAARGLRNGEAARGLGNGQAKPDAELKPNAMPETQPWTEPNNAEPEAGNTGTSAPR